MVEPAADESRPPGIVLDEVTKVHPGATRPAVDRLSLTVPAGSITVLIGPSGCGKTTTLRMINRLEEPTGGTVSVGGRDVSSVPPERLRRGIGYAVQHCALFPHMTVERNVSTVPSLLRWGRKAIARRVDDVLDLVGLEPRRFRDRYPHELSGGQQQRVGVARALAADPPVLLMDEPFSAADPITRGRLQAMLSDLQASLGTTVVVVTHDLAEAVALADRLAVLDGSSHVLQYAAPGEILRAPADDTVAEFIGADASANGLALLRLRHLDLLPAGTSPPDAATAGPLTMDTPAQAALEELLASGAASARVVDGAGRLRGIITLDGLVTTIRARRGAAPGVRGAV